MSCKNSSFVFNQCTAIEECGHRFCLECITEKLRQNPECPVCKVPTQSNDLHRDYLQDNLVDYLDHLKKLSLNHTLTPLELSYQTRSETEEEPSLTDLIGKRKKSPDSSPRKRQATDQGIDALLESIIVENPEQEHDALIDKGDDAKNQTKDEANNSDTQWKCPDCQFDNPIYVQTCSVCRKPKNMPVIQGTGARFVPKTANANKGHETQSYIPTVATDNEPESATIAPDKTQSTENNKRKEVHVMYTGLASEDEETLSKLVDSKRDTKLKIFVHFKTRDFHDVTHIITSVDNKRLCKRTFKYLQGVLEGKWIVTPAYRWLPEDAYEVKGDHVTGITQAPFKGRERVQQDKEPLFNGMKFYFFGDFTGKHSKNDLLLLCRAGGGKILNRKPNGLGQRVDPDIDPLDRNEPIVIMCTGKKKPTNQWLYESQVRDPSWIIECISKLSIV
ncbi:hypothetical protein RMCBS344292_05810 [Rhizopus microsporus]|nr:hypothetical protein RMCBS344292_05810 [Rhizopus microsporus]